MMLSTMYVAILNEEVRKSENQNHTTIVVSDNEKLVGDRDQDEEEKENDEEILGEDGVQIFMENGTQEKNMEDQEVF